MLWLAIIAPRFIWKCAHMVIITINYWGGNLLEWPCTPGALATRAAMVQEAPIKIYARGVVSYFYFHRSPGALKFRQINSAILKVPDGASSC
jgi:hypothetical protein